MLVTPTLQIRSDTILQYAAFDRLPARGSDLINRLTNNLKEQETYTGKFCPGAKKRLTRAIELLVMCSEKKKIFNPVTKQYLRFKLNFITLTIHSPDRMITAKEAHKTCLEPFLQYLRRVHGVKAYIWKAELQKRGQVHYHIVTETYLPYNQIRQKWNALQKAAGYLDQFKATYGHYNAPSTEVRKLRKEQNTATYLIKEIAKTIQNTDSVHGKVWDCSQNLKSASYYTTTVDSQYHSTISNLIERGKIKPVYTDHCIIFKFTADVQPLHVLSSRDQGELKDLMFSIRKRELNKPQPVKEDIVIIKPPPIIKIPVIPDLFTMN